MSYESISKLASLTGKDRTTIAKRVKDLTFTEKANAKLYESTEALPVIYGLDSQGDLDLTGERARLTFHQANKTELEVAQLRGDLIPREIVIATWQAYSANARAKLLSLPTKAAHAAIAATQLHEIEEVLKEQVYEALAELASDGIPDGFQGVQPDIDGVDTTTEPDSEPVGGSVSETERGGKRRTRSVAN